MEKRQLIRIFKIENIAVGVLLTVVVGWVLLFSGEKEYFAYAIGILAGSWFAVVFKHFKQIPNDCGKKDERELIITIIAGSIGVSLACVGFAILYGFAALGHLQFDMGEFSFSVLLLTGLALLIRAVSYRVMNKYL